MHEKVIINKTNEEAFIVWFNEDEIEQDSYLLEVKGKNEMPEFYKSDEFHKVNE